MKIGILRETKVPADSRVAITPMQCKKILRQYPDVQIVVQPSDTRCFSDEEYKNEGISLQENISDCDVLLGVKEVDIDTFIPEKTYFFFSHTIKEQPYNRTLLQTVLKKKITLVDYEVLLNKAGQRVIAFGRWAGIVGAHNGIYTWGKKTRSFHMKRMFEHPTFNEAKSTYSSLPLGNVRIVITGTGRVANGAAEVLEAMNIQRVSKADFLQKEHSGPVYCQLQTEDMFSKGGEIPFEKAFYDNPEGYYSIFLPITKKADILINGIYWDNRAPALFSKEDMQLPDFSIQVIADITCDIAPVSSIPSTLRATTISDPVFGYDPDSGTETTPYLIHVVDMMTVDNLPNELPRDASNDFGNQFFELVLPELYKEKSAMIHHATIAKKGKLNEPYVYLADYVNQP